MIKIARLWSAVRSGDTQTVDLITTKIQEREPHELGHFVGVFSRYINDYGEVSELHVLKTIASKRKEWLKQEMEKLDKVGKEFSWRMPYADFSPIKEFLQGPNQSCTVRWDDSEV
ncbi:hypothetical protein GQ600_9580 [Phytophthora cactorum]|nr:hypothetical protein GQ600_9580 [Phytophthora cactorum]